MNDEIKPCPFCGSSNIEVKDMAGWEIWCKDCGVLGSSTDRTTGEAFTSREACVEVWNRRAPSASIADTAERKMIAQLLHEFGDHHYHGCPADFVPEGECDCFAGALCSEARALLSASIADTAGAKADEQEMTALNVAIMVLKKEGIFQNAHALENLRNRLAAPPAPSSDTAGAKPLNGIPATLRHGEGAIARCSYCGRYSLDPKTLSDRQPKCDCGERHGWSGSFKKPDCDAKWSGAAPTAPSVADAAGASEDAKRLLWFSRRVTVEMLNAYTRHVLSRGGDGDLSDIRTFIDAAIEKESGND